MRGAKVECVLINMSYLDLSLKGFILVVAELVVAVSYLAIVALRGAPN